MPEDRNIFKKMRDLFNFLGRNKRNIIEPHGSTDDKIVKYMQELLDKAGPQLPITGTFGFEWLTTLSQQRRNRYKDYDEVYLRVPELSAACIVYASNVLQRNYEGDFFRIETSLTSLDNLIKGFFKRINMDSKLWILVHDLMKYGDLFVELVKNQRGSIVQLKIHRPETIICLVDESDHTYGYIKINENRFNQMLGQLTSLGIHGEREFIRLLNLQLMAKTDPGEANKIIKKYRQYISIFSSDDMVHFKLSPSSLYSPYGVSILEYPRGIIKQLLFMELSLIIYRVTRAPEHRIFNVEVGDVAPAKVRDYMERFKNSVKREKVLTSMQTVTSIPNLLTQQDDYYIPNTFGSPLYSIETTAAGDLTSKIDDINWLWGRLFAALRIPRSYLSFDEDAPSFAALTAVDQRFARIVDNYQRDFAVGLKKIVDVQLKCIGKNHLSPYYEIKMHAAQQTLEQEQIDAHTRKVDLATSYKNLGFPTKWVWRNIFKFTDDEITEIEVDQEREKASALGKEDPDFEPPYSGM